MNKHSIKQLAALPFPFRKELFFARPSSKGIDTTRMSHHHDILLDQNHATPKLRRASTSRQSQLLHTFSGKGKDQADGKTETWVKNNTSVFSPSSISKKKIILKTYTRSSRLGGIAGETCLRWQSSQPSGGAGRVQLARPHSPPAFASPITKKLKKITKKTSGTEENNAKASPTYVVYLQWACISLWPPQSHSLVQSLRLRSAIKDVKSVWTLEMALSISTHPTSFCARHLQSLRSMITYFGR